MSSDWISYFGYGSLVNRDTRPLDEVAHKACLRGWQRVWEHRVVGSASRKRCTSLSIEPNAGGSSAGIDGVVVSMPRSLLPALDEREAGYERLELPASDFDLPEHLEVKTVMIYRSLEKNRHASDHGHPVLQSYIDCVLAGYHDLFDEPGMQAFIASTRGWDGAIFNDRHAPRYPRWVEVADQQQDKYDALVQQHRLSNY